MKQKTIKELKEEGVDLFTTEQAAQILNVHKETIRRMIKRGEFSKIKIGRNYRIRLEEVERFTGGK